MTQKYKIDPTMGVLVSLVIPIWLTWEVITKHPERWQAIPLGFGLVGVGYVHFYVPSFVAIVADELRIVRIIPVKKIPISDIEKIEKVDTPTHHRDRPADPEVHRSCTQ
jgi:hypothetical protein